MEETGRVTLDVYPERELHRRFIPYDALGNPLDHPVLAQPAILIAPGHNDLPTSGEVSFGDQLFLLGSELPAAAAANEPLRIRTAWRTGLRQIENAYIIGVYLFLDDVFVTNQDSPPADGSLQTFSLLPSFHFDDEKWLVAPDAPGVYDVYVGVYDLWTMERLTVAKAANSLQLIGSIEIE